METMSNNDDSKPPLWFLQLVACLINVIGASFGFWMWWTVNGVGKKFFPDLGQRWLDLGFWDTVQLAFIIDIVAGLVFRRRYFKKD